MFAADRPAATRRSDDVTSPRERGLHARCCRAVTALGLLGTVLCALAQPAPADTSTAATEPEAIAPARDLHEDTLSIEVSVRDLFGREETKRIPLLIFRPDGAGPHPLLIMNHGRAPSQRRATQGVQRFEALARYFVAKGFVVILPTRVGYGPTYGDFDPESTGPCTAMRLEPQAQAASDQVLATLAFARTLPYVDASRWVVAGQSVGGLTAVATTWRHPPGLVGGINFSGGTGGDPEHSPGRPCNPQRIEAFWRSRAAEAVAPMLWLYWANDEYWGAEVPKRWHAAWFEGGGQAEFHQLAAVRQTGHGGVNADMDHWVPYVEAFLARLGFDRPGMAARPAASRFAAIDSLAQAPIAGSREPAYRRFLASATPRAFAVGADGASGWATGDWAAGRALGFCQRRRNAACRLYAVDDDVVWTP